MKIHSIQHVPFEDLANIGVWAQQQGHDVSTTCLYADQALPDVNSFDWLVIMGGPMNIYEHDQYPWLVKEKTFIRQAIDAGRVVLGICLGGQLIADCLGGQVVQSPNKEIGWHQLEKTPLAAESLLASLPQTFQAFQWHGDMFSVPPEAKLLAASPACPNQAFQYRDRVLGMQFHLDYSAESIQKMCEYCSDELVPAPYIQSDPSVLVDPEKAIALQKTLFQVLDQVQTLSV